VEGLLYSEYGQPSPLAYKLDTLIINRRIEEAGKPVPNLIRLGSQRDLCKELGINEGQGVKHVKKALLQNAFAGITAKFTYKTTKGEERFAEIADTRYGVIFTGERLPSGEKADGVYLILHDIYREILNTAQTRPLDYDYMRSLTPAAQRFYELLSYQMYAALKNHTTARMLYSEYCTYAPQVRYFDWDHIKKQMYKLHRPHLASEYIERVSFERYRRDDGEPDWLMIYVPGKRARGQHVAFQRKPVPRLRIRERNPAQGSLLPEERPPERSVAFPDPLLNFTADEERLVVNLRKYGIAERRARHLVKAHRAAVEAQLAAYPYRDASKTKRNAAGWLVAAIEENYTLPVAYLEAQEERQRATKAKDTKASNEQIAQCDFCDERGWRQIVTEKYPRGAMKRCTHDPQIETRYAAP
jgi:hypothetical protein